MRRSRPASSLSQAEALVARVPPEQRAAVIDEFTRSLPPSIADALPWTWSFWRRPSQQQPAEYRLWRIRAGRGFGKNRTASEVIRENVNAGRWGRLIVVGQSASAVRDVIVEGESGILAVHPPSFRPTYEPSKRLITWPNGATALCYSAEDPEKLRGPQSDAVIGDEPESWVYGEEAWSNAMFGNRLGKNPQAVLIGTPKRRKWIRDIETQRGTVVTTGSTYDNVANLAESFVEYVLDMYEGTRLGAQEIDAEYLDDVEGALWDQSTINHHRLDSFDRGDPWHSLKLGVAPGRTAAGLGLWVPATGEHRRWITWVGVDPPAENGAECGIVVVTAPTNAVAGRDHFVVLDDLSVRGTPETWGGRVVEAVKKWDALGAVVEANQGGDMARATVHAVDPAVKVQKVRATESKHSRAEPVSALFARGWGHMLGTLGPLETQMTTWVPDEPKQPSPDRIDALVHAVRHVMRWNEPGKSRTSGGRRARAAEQTPTATDPAPSTPTAVGTPERRRSSSSRSRPRTTGGIPPRR